MSETPSPPDPGAPNRRPIRARGHALARLASAWLARSGVSPNAISVASVAFAALGAAALLAGASPWGPWLCAACVQARLLCNLFDGMVAIEGGKASAVGALYNEVPDRVADSLLLVALGFAAGAPWLGWLGALLAALTAYVRALGGALGQPQAFGGPMAKQHRMATMTAACVLAPIEAATAGSRGALLAAAAAIAAGSALTCWTRLRAVAARLRAGP